MKKVLKFIGFSILGFILLAILITACSGGSETKTEDDATETTAPAKAEKQESKEKAAPKKEEKQYNIGDSLKVGDVVFTVNGMETASNVGGQFGMNASGKYLIVDMVVKNEGKEAITIDSSFFKVLGNGVEYKADGSADIYANEAGKSFFLQSVNPGVEFKGKMVFDLPKEVAESDNLKLNVQTGAFGTEQGKVNLK